LGKQNNQRAGLDRADAVVRVSIDGLSEDGAKTGKPRSNAPPRSPDPREETSVSDYDENARQFGSWRHGCGGSSSANKSGDYARVSILSCRRRRTRAQSMRPNRVGAESYSVI
jgi:hypothetical protein